MDNQDKNNKSQISDEKSTRIRSMIYSMAGFYLIYQAYSAYKDISAASGNTNTMMMITVIFLAIAGLGMIVFGTWIGYKSMKKKDEEEK